MTKGLRDGLYLVHTSVEAAALAELAELAALEKTPSAGGFGSKLGRFANKNRKKSQKIDADFEIVLLMTKELVAVFAAE
jgi:hypothetical protein